MPTVYKAPSFFVFLCCEIVLRSFNGAVMCRMYVAPLDFGTRILKPLSISKELIMILEEYYSYLIIGIREIMESEVILTYRSSFV
jgi:hypothetical protein